MSRMINGPFQRLPNFPCFPGFSLLLSHKRTISLIWKALGLADLSKVPFILSWCLSDLSRAALRDSSNSTIWFILCSISAYSMPYSLSILKIRICILIGRVAVSPYNSSKGDLPVEFFLVILSAHTAYLILLSHDLLLSPTVFLRIDIKFLLVDSASPLPCG